MITDQDYKFARQSGQTFLRPDYANPITHYKPSTNVNVVFYGVLAFLVIGIFAIVLS